VRHYELTADDTEVRAVCLALACKYRPRHHTAVKP
jgi:hypothetical protein